VLRGERYLESGNPDAAIESFQSALNCPGTPGPGEYIRLAALLKERGAEIDLEEAVCVLNKGLRKHGCLSQLHTMAIDIELERGEYDEALGHVNALVARYRPQVPFALKRAEILEAASRFREAAHAVDQAHCITGCNSAGTTQSGAV
jgi:tetratricopeptide (TPR) repeat protein